jgi:hypothetical protein
MPLLARANIYKLQGSTVAHFSTAIRSRAPRRCHYFIASLLPYFSFSVVCYCASALTFGGLVSKPKSLSILRYQVSSSLPFKSTQASSLI